MALYTVLMAVAYLPAALSQSVTTTVTAPGGCRAASPSAGSLAPNSPVSLPTSGVNAGMTTLNTIAPSISTIPVPATSSVSHAATGCSSIAYSGTSVVPDTSLPFATGMLQRHNYLRQFHGSSTPMVWSDALAVAAQAEVNTCVFQHTANNVYGENLAGISRTGGYTAGQLVIAVDEWYGEISAYDFSNPGFSSATGHFTQVVWLGSNTLGCAWKDCTGTPLGLYFVACEYAPQGNIANPGYFQANVLPPVASVDSCASGTTSNPGKVKRDQPGYFRGRRMARVIAPF